MKKLFLTFLVAAFAITTMSFASADVCGPQGCFPAFGQGQPLLIAQAQVSPLSPRDANAMSRPIQKTTAPQPQQQPATQQAVPHPKATFGPPIVVPWKRGGTYSMVDVQKALQTLGWWISEAKNDAGQYYNPPKLELAAIDDEKWKILKKDVHMQAVKKFGKGSQINENDRHTAQWQHKLFRGGINGVRAAIVDVVPPTSTSRR